MKSILRINTQLLNNNVEEQELINDNACSKKYTVSSTLYSDHIVNVLKMVLSKNDVEYDSSLKVIIKSVKNLQLLEHKERLFKLSNMRNKQSFNNINDKLNIDDKIKNDCYPLLSTLNVLFTSHVISFLLYDIVTLFEEFSDSHIMNIKHLQGGETKVINIPKSMTFIYIID